MTRPTFEVADILRLQGDRFLDRYRSSFGFQQLKAFRAILRCRTAALGGHRDACPSCGHQAISYNSCRNRHCPKCQTQGRERWLAARERELLTTSYFHVVFTVPHELNVLAFGKSAFVLRPVIHRQRSNLAGDRHRSQTPGRRDRRDQPPAYLGTEPASASPHSLRHSCRWTLARTHMHNVRSKWVRLTAPHLKVPPQLNRAHCTPQQARAGLAESAARCAEMLVEALGGGGGCVEKFRRDGWARPWAVGVEMLCYMLSHEDYHRW